VVYLSSWAFFAALFFLFKFEGKKSKPISGLFFFPDFFSSSISPELGCITNMDSYWDALLFSLQTQATIGYGNYHIRPQDGCTAPLMVASAQSLFGLILDASTLGLLFVKISLPSNRATNIRFSNQAVVWTKEGKKLLSFRIADMHSEQLVEGHATLLCYRHHRTTEGEVLDLEAVHLAVSPCEYIPLLLPQIISHEINESSPLFGMSVDDMQREDIVLIALYEGTGATTGTSVQARKSYSGSDIAWDYTFRTISSFSHGNRVISEYSRFDELIPQDRITIS
jgi:hypothetical protein